MANQQKKNDQAGKARLGSIGENLVITKLMQQGWDAFNANCTIKNYKSIDIVCLNSELKESDELWWKPKTSLVQVKTSVQTNIPTGFTIEESLDKDYLEKMVKGMPGNTEYVVCAFTRVNSEQKTKELAEGIWGVGKFNPASNDKTRHVVFTIPYSESNEKIAEEMKKLLEKVKAYRDSNFIINK